MTPNPSSSGIWTSRNSTCTGRPAHAASSIAERASAPPLEQLTRSTRTSRFRRLRSRSLAGFSSSTITEQSTNYAEPSIKDYDERRARLLEYWKAQNGQQSGDPAKLARALITIAGQDPPPRRFIAGADAIATAEQKVADLKAQIEANRTCRHHSLSTNSPQYGKANMRATVIMARAVSASKLADTRLDGGDGCAVSSRTACICGSDLGTIEPAFSRTRLSETAIVIGM
jgi:hypothetical protein